MATLRAGGFFVSGGTMPLDSASYVERASDKALLESLLAGRYCYVLNSRQMGKSSLSVRVMSRLSDEGIGTVLIDLTRIGGRNVTALQWYAGLCDEVGGSLGLRAEAMAHFRQNSELSPLQRFFGALDKVVLTEIPGRIVIFIDEIDATRNLNFDADEFFAGIRECYNRRVQDPRFERLGFCLIGVAVPTDLIRNPSTTPFNIGERIPLNDFTLEEMSHLAAPLGPTGAKLVKRVHYWTGGQPFLTQSLCEAISRIPNVATESEVDDVVRAQLFDPKARTTNINLADVGNRALHCGDQEADPIRFQADLLSAYERICRGGSIPDDESNRIAVMLKLSGLTRSDGRRLLRRNRIYEHVFDRTWIRENMPNRELLRERRAFRRGIVRAASASAAVVGIVSVFAIAAWRSKQAEVEASRALDYELYVADLNNMRLLEETGDVARMKQLLARTESSPYRGFEWAFWQRRIHDSDEEYTLDYSAPGKREEGILSADGRTVCVYDSLAGIASIVDRATKRTLVSRNVGQRERIVAAKGGFLALDTTQMNKRIQAMDLLTGNIQSTYEPENNVLGSVYLRPQSSLILVTETAAEGSGGDILLFDMANSQVIHRTHFPHNIPAGPLSFSSGGRWILYGLGVRTDGNPKVDRVVIEDTRTGRVTDSRLGDRLVSETLLDLSESGRYIFFQDNLLGTLRYDTVTRKSFAIRGTTGSEVPSQAFSFGQDRVVAALYPTGHADFMQFTDASPFASVRHVWNLNPGADSKHVVASSTSVRMVSLESAGNGSVLADGIRLMRNDGKGISIWRGPGQGIDVYRDPDLEFVAHYNSFPGQRSGYTYNGNWCMVGSPSSRGGWIVDARNAGPSFRLDPLPVNFSCGNDGSKVVILDSTSTHIVSLSTKTGKASWDYVMPKKGVTSLWATPDGANVLVGMGDTDLLVIDGATGKLRTRFQGHNVRLSNLSFSADGKHVFTCGADGRTILWDLVRAERVREFMGNVAQRVASADLSPDGSRVATCNLAGAWQLWDARTGVQLMEIQASAMPLRSILFTSDGRNVLTAGDDGQVRRWPILERDPTVRIPVPQEFLKGIKR